MSDDHPLSFVDPRTKPARVIQRRDPMTTQTATETTRPVMRRASGNLTTGQKRLARLAFVSGFIVTIAGYLTNFTSVSDYAAKHHFKIPMALPIGLDLAIPTLLAIDYLATVKGANAAFLRWAAWTLTGFTVFAGAVAANDGQKIDWGSTVLHGVMPAISVVFVEAARWYRMHLDGLTDGTHTDRIPIARWVCAPVRTGRMRRRMVLWNERSYPTAVVREAALLYAQAILDGEGRTKRTTPVSLRHQVRTGQVPSIVVQAMRSAVENGDESWQPAVEEWVSSSLVKVARTRSEEQPSDRSEESDQKRSESDDETRSKDRTGDRTKDRSEDDDETGPKTRSETPKKTGPKRRRKTGPKTRSGTDFADLLERARELNTAHLQTKGKPISADNLRAAMRIGKPVALDLVKQVRGGHIDVAK